MIAGLAHTYERLEGDALVKSGKLRRHGAECSAPATRAATRAEVLRSSRGRLFYLLATFRGAELARAMRATAEEWFARAAAADERRELLARTGPEVSPPVVRWETRADHFRMCAADFLRVTSIFYPESEAAA